MLYVFKIIGKKLNALQKGKELLIGEGRTMQQETLVTKYYVQIVGLSERHRHKAFQIIELSLKSCGMEC